MENNKFFEDITLPKSYDDQHSSDFSRKNINQVTTETFGKKLSRMIQAKFGFNPRGRRSGAEIILCNKAQEILAEKLKDHEDLSNDEIAQIMQAVVNSLTTEDAKDATTKAAKAEKTNKKIKVDTSLDDNLVQIDQSIKTMDPVVVSSLNRLTRKDLMDLYSRQLPGKLEVQYLVDTYYQMQHTRITFAAQERAAKEANEPFHSIEFFFNEFDGIENQIKMALDAYTEYDKIGWTVKQVCGIGPVISAGIISNFDVTKTKTQGGFIRYAGMDPTAGTRVKGEKLGYNPFLKTLMVFKLGESFIKVQNRENDIYGKVFKEAKQLYLDRSEAGVYKEYAKQQLASKNWKKTDSDAFQKYSEGKIPDAQIYSRARRKAVTLFIQHLFDFMYREHYHCREPYPYIFEYGEVKADGTRAQHVHYIPNPLIPIYEARYGKIPMDHEAPHTLLKDSRGANMIDQF